jgi:hypothetical protein
MPYEYVPTGLGATANTGQLVQQRATNTTQYPKVSLISGEKVYGPTATETAVAKTPAVSFPKIPASKAPRPTSLPRVPLTPIKTPKVLTPIPRALLTGVLATPAPKPPMVRVHGNQAKQMTHWFNRRFGTVTPKIRGLKFEDGAVIVPRVWFERFNDARKRVMRMRSKTMSLSTFAAKEAQALGLSASAATSSATNKFSQFISWWHECDLDSWAAWDNEVVTGTGSNLVPATPFSYWIQRSNIRAVVSPATGVVAAIKPPSTLQVIPGVVQAPPARSWTMTVQPGQIQAPASRKESKEFSSLIDNAPASTSSSPNTVRDIPGSMTMSGMGGLGATVSGRLDELRAKAQQRRAEKSRESSARRAMLVRHNEERARVAGKTAAQRIADAGRRQQERAALQAASLVALRRRQAERTQDIASITRGIRAGITASVQTASEQRRQNRSVPCPTGVLKVTLFGGVPPRTPSAAMMSAPTPSTTAQEAAIRATEEEARQKAKLEEHHRRMEKLLHSATEATKLTAGERKNPEIAFDDTTHTLIDEEMVKIEEAAANAEETKIVSDEKEEQINEIETLLEDLKDRLEQAQAQLVDGNKLTEEMKKLQEQIDQLQGALTDAKIEHEESLIASAEASQAQATMMQAEIDRLNALLAVQPEVAPVVTGYLRVYGDDLTIANQDIADAEVAIRDAQENISLEAQVASQTRDDIVQTQPFHVRHRNVLLFGGAVALGAGFWWWKSQKMAQPLYPPFTKNDGYYNLPEPKTPRRPSGF